MLSSQPSAHALGPSDSSAEQKVEDCRAAERLALCHQLAHLLRCFDGPAIAQELQRLHNAQPAEVRQGYRMEIRLLSRSYQLGAYDPSL